MEELHRVSEKQRLNINLKNENVGDLNRTVASLKQDVNNYKDIVIELDEYKKWYLKAEKENENLKYNEGFMKEKNAADKQEMNSRLESEIRTKLTMEF